MQVNAETGTVCVCDRGEVVCRFDIENWSDTSEAPDIDPPVDATVTGRVTGLRFPPGSAVPGCGDRRSVETPKKASGLRGPIRVETTVTAVVAFEGPATVRERSGGIGVSFADARPVTVGLRRSCSRRDRTITVPGTAEGVATALTHASVAHATSTPARSDPATRRNPPRIERDDAVDVPDAIRTEQVDTGIELRVPPDRASLYVLAPLAYYLGARVSVESRTVPLLRAPDTGVSCELSSLPELQADAASLLYRTVTLDCLLREARENAGGDAERLLARAGIAPGVTGGADIDDRLAAYLDAPFSTVKSELPEWHLSVYVTPTPTHVTVLPYILDRLAFVYLPDANPLPKAERLQRSLADFHRASDSAPSVEPILPDLNRGRLHGWLADGVAIDAFRLLPETDANRRSLPPVDADAIDVTLVINDGEMRPEMEAIRRLCSDRSDAVGVDLRVERRLDCDGLAATLRRPTDLFYYIGHCDRSGLRCADGHLDVADIDHSGARTFFLNACGSYEQGVSMIEAGSVVGAVTLRPVLDGQAKRVGTTFARLVIRGFAVERALRIASRRAIMNKDYAVVGDGAYGLAGSDGADRVVLRVSPVDDRFHVAVEHGPAQTTATYRRSLLAEETCLSGSERSASMSRSELCTLLDDLGAPALYEDSYYWAPDLRRALLKDDLDR
ncbi:MAG: hypothetical protein ABEH88_07475 [Halobacteriales archaeon]